MEVSKLAAICAVGLTLFNEVPRFINKPEEEDYPYYVSLSVITSALWVFYHYSNNNPVGKITSTIFLGINLIFLIRCLQQRTGFLTRRTSQTK